MRDHAKGGFMGEVTDHTISLLSSIADSPTPDFRTYFLELGGAAGDVSEDATAYSAEARRSTGSPNRLGTTPVTMEVFRMAWYGSPADRRCSWAGNYRNWRRRRREVALRLRATEISGWCSSKAVSTHLNLRRQQHRAEDLDE